VSRPKVTDRTDEIADAIESVSAAARLLLDGHLTERAVVLLIHDSCKADERGKKPGKKEIARILHAAKNLDVAYLRLDEDG